MAVMDAVGVRVAVGVVELDAPRDSVAVGDAVCEGDAEGLCGPHGSAGTASKQRCVLPASWFDEEPEIVQKPRS